MSQVQPVELVAASYKELLLVNVFERRFDVVRHCQADSRHEEDNRYRRCL